MASVTKIAHAELPEEFSAKYDQLKREAEKARRGRAADQKRRELQNEIIAAMGESRLARLADGRLLQRIAKQRHCKARPACDQQWEELVEAQLD